MKRSISASSLFWNARSALAWVLAFVAFAYFALTDPNFLNTGNIYALMQIFSITSLAQLALALLAVVYLKLSWRGRFLYAVGSDAGRARASGLPVTATLIFAFVICAVFTAVAGSLQGLSLATGQSGTDEAFLLQVATAALVGGVALTGGKGSLVGVFGGALLLSLLSNGLGLAGVDAPIIELVDGVVLIFVVLVDRPINRLIDRRLKAELAQGVPP